MPKKNSELRMAIGNRIKELLYQRKILTIKDFTELLAEAGYATYPSVIGDIVNGITSPQIEFWPACQKVLGISLDYIIMGQDFIVHELENVLNDINTTDPMTKELIGIFERMPDEHKAKILAVLRKVGSV